MANMIIVAPTPITGITATRGSGIANLLTPDPKEVWADTVAGSAVTIDVDLGAAQAIDTIFLGHVYGPRTDATWAITGGAVGYTDIVVKADGALRVADGAGKVPSTSHALWFGPQVAVRYLRLILSQPAGGAALMAGVLIAGKAFQPALNREWGSGRRPIDTGVATPLPGGGFGIAEGVRKRSFSWTFGDLSEDEVHQLEDIALECGETRPVLVVEDPALTGLRRRIHYGKFATFRPFERRNRAQTRWELGVEGWV